jgi:hypothetical protein
MPDLPGAKDRESTALAAIIANVKRLIRDAEILQERGNAGSALTLAILGFEDGGPRPYRRTWLGEAQIGAHSRQLLPHDGIPGASGLARPEAWARLERGSQQDRPALGRRR